MQESYRKMCSEIPKYSAGIFIYVASEMHENPSFGLERYEELKSKYENVKKLVPKVRDARTRRACGKLFRDFVNPSMRELGKAFEGAGMPEGGGGGYFPGCEPGTAAVCISTAGGALEAIRKEIRKSEMLH